MEQQACAYRLDWHSDRVVSFAIWALCDRVFHILVTE